ncbi:MAG TPA: hypothetical protein VFO73_01130 [Candidatus Limnocylindrales bacterium]|nr:hypothetical protein [Candidatus Limnocylindrales bacterium]
MAKQKLKDRDNPKEARGAGEAGTAGGRGTKKAGGGHGAGHHAAKAHGKPATVDASLPTTREELLVRHAEARRRRAAAPLGSDAFRDAADELGRIEVRIAAVEREMVPPRT